MSDSLYPLSMIAATPMTTQAGKSTGSGGSGTWFEAMANAWGQALDKQASVIEQRSAALDNGGDTPSAITELTAESMRMGFLSNSSHSAISAVSEALQTMARKQ